MKFEGMQACGAVRFNHCAEPLGPGRE